MIILHSAQDKPQTHTYKNEYTIIFKSTAEMNNILAEPAKTSKT